jgi:IclR family acetate operon transcriptional repressor
MSQNDTPDDTPMPAATAATGATGSVQAVTRALDLLRILAETPGGIGLSPAARKAGLAASTAHRLLNTLAARGWASFDAAHNLWRVGPEAFITGQAFDPARHLAAAARPVMQRLMERSGETVNLAIRADDRMLYLAQVECAEMMRAFARPGARVPMISTGVGKALLAAGSRPLPVQATGTGSEGLAAELAVIAARGWALDDEEQSVGLRCVAAAISPPRGLQPIAALSISGPTARISNDRLDALGRMVVDAAADIGRAL